MRSQSETIFVPAVTDENISVPGFFQNWRGFARDGGFVDVGDSLDDRAVRREDIVPFDANHIAYAQLRSWHGFDHDGLPIYAWRRDSSRVWRSAVAFALPRPSAKASAKFANQTVNTKTNVTTPLYVRDTFVGPNSSG